MNYVRPEIRADIVLFFGIKYRKGEISDNDYFKHLSEQNLK